jgi:hypothetical protein
VFDFFFVSRALAAGEIVPREPPSPSSRTAAKGARIPVDLVL